MRATIRAAMVLVLAAGVAACSDDEANVLKIVETDNAFAIEGEPEAGTLSIEVSNEGEEFHQLAMAKLVDGKTLDDVREALEGAEDGSENPLGGLVEEESTLDDLGGVQLPGTAYTVTGSGMDAGDYVVICFIPDAEGTPHFATGMLSGFTIGEGEVDDEPEADVTYTANDDELDGPDELEAGTTTISVVNDSSVNREITILKIDDGKTPEDVTEWFASAGDAPPSVTDAPVGYLAYIFDAEQDRTVELDLTAGQWVISFSDPEHPFEGDPADDPHTVIVTVT